MEFTKRSGVAWMLLLLTMLFAGASSAMETGLDVQSLLRRPGVKLVAVEFYADWCKPCMAAVPKWKALHEKYRAKGLHLVVVSVGDQAGCSSPGWNPDLTVCDLDTSIQKRLGANPLPQAFLWNWQGQLIASHAPVEQVEAAIERYFAETPRILVSDPKDENGAPVKNAVALREQIKTLLKNQAKFDLVASASEQATLKALRKESHAAAYDEAGACEVGSAVSANSELKVKVMSLAPGRRKLLLQLYSVEQGCLKAASDAPIQGADTEGAVFTAVSSLVEQLIGKSGEAAPSASAPAKTAPAPVADNYEELMAKARVAEEARAKAEKEASEAKQRAEAEASKRRGEMDAAWEKAQKVAVAELAKADKISYVRAFLSKYPVGNPHESEAEQLIKDIEAGNVAGAGAAGKAGIQWIYSQPAKLQFAKTETTVDQYGACVAAGKCTKPIESSVVAKCNYGSSDRGNHPVNCVDWNQSTAFCEWAGGRLPTEEEWAAEASNGGSRDYPWGAQEVTCDYAIWGDGDKKDGCGKEMTWPVCSKPKGNSVSGLCDMSGNVWEWTSSLYKSGEAARVLRGGSWSYGLTGYLRASGRFWNDPTYRSLNYGFRCVRSSR